MKTPLRALLRVALILFLITPAFAQYQAQEGNQGITSYVTFQGSDSDQGQVMKLDPSLGYNFNSHFGMNFGVPMYFVRTPATATSPSTSNNGLGNAYVDLKLTYLHQVVNFSSTLTGYAPTGNRDNGLSTGRATFDWNNHFDRSFSRLTPFIEVGVGNTILDSNFFTRPFTTLGFNSHLTGGANFNLWRFISVGASAYSVMPVGDQKVYSKLVKQGGTAKGSGSHGRVYETNSLTTGGADIARDGGFSSWIDANPSETVVISLGYNRSMHYDLNVMSFGVGVNLEKVFKKAGSH
jgi:hypothetical protein